MVIVVVAAEAIEDALNADHPVAGELVVATDLAAPSEAITRQAAFRKAVDRHFGFGASPADVGPDVAAGPCIDRWRRWRRRLVDGRFEIGSESRTDDEGCQESRRDDQLFHWVSPPT